jgi:hypothetical protein
MNFQGLCFMQKKKLEKKTTYMQNKTFKLAETKYVILSCSVHISDSLKGLFLLVFSCLSM